MSTRRIEYIDALRGFAMILVVSPHILVFGCSHSLGDDFSLGGNNFLSFNSLFVLFHMPLFFFISGFLLYKKNFEWNLRNIASLIVRKGKMLLIPTLFFLFIYTFITDASFIDCCCKSSKWGYWFTVALFEYFVIYAPYRYICNLLGKKNGIDWILIIGSLMLYFMVTPSCLRWLNIFDTTVCGIIGLDNLKYFLFFAIGTLVNKHFCNIQMLLDKSLVSGVGILLFFGMCIYVLHDGYFSNALITHLFLITSVLITSGFLGLMIVFSFFRKYQSAFTSDTVIGKSLQYIGRRTLDIYLLHYFFLPRNLEVIGRFFSNNPNQTLELVLSLILALIVIGICLVTSQIIRISPILAHWLFGAKTTN